MPITRDAINATPGALRVLANEIQSPDYIPQLCLQEAADMIEELRACVADAIRRPMGVIPASAEWIGHEELEEAEKRRVGLEQSSGKEHPDDLRWVLAWCAGESRPGRGEWLMVKYVNGNYVRFVDGAMRRVKVKVWRELPPSPIGE